MNKKVKVFLVFIGIISLILSLFFLYRYRKQTSSPTPIKDSLILIEAYPPQGKNPSFNPTIGIIFQFDSPVKLSTANVQILPDTFIELELAKTNQNQLIIRPQVKWATDTEYEITINKGLLSQDENKELKEDLLYKIEFETTPEDVIQIPPPGSRVQ